MATDRGAGAVSPPAAVLGRVRWVDRRPALRRHGDQLCRPPDASACSSRRSQKEFGWSETTYADIVFWFQARLRGRLHLSSATSSTGSAPGCGYAAAFVIWTDRAHAPRARRAPWSASPPSGFLLGIGESGNFPAGIKAVTEWFPKKERALATGIFNAGINIGAIVTPLIVPAITLAYGWRAAFVITGAVEPDLARRLAGALPPPARIEAACRTAELAYIESDPADPAAKVAVAAGCSLQRETWAFAIGKFLTDPVWWMFLFWLPDFLAQAPRPRPEDLRSAAGRHLHHLRRRHDRPAAGFPRA